MIPSRPTLRRFLGFSTALTLALPLLPNASLAQDAPAAPPARVGQINSLAGSVSFNGSGSGGWAAAAANYPVNAGDSIYTQDNSRAGIALDSSQITLSSDTELEVTGLNDQTFAATLAQGEAAFAVNYLLPGQVFTISTPRGTISISQNGQYDIAAGDTNTPTLVNVYEGAATVSAPGLDLQIAAGQAGVLSGTDQTTAQLGQAQQDSFTETALAQNTTPPPSYVPTVSTQMTGVTELSQYGAWQQNPQYGAVWYPAVGAGWAPYREGHWANIPPWGWTWVEAEPWGFAPFHYGRWIDEGGRWGWAPAPAYEGGGYGPAYHPVYAPAVVSFFGAALAAGITAAVLSSGSVGWVPLAPNEPYYPSYHASPAYIRRINIVNVRNINDVHITNNYYYGSNFSPDQLANRRAATFVSADVMSRGEHVAGFARTPPQNELAAFRPIDTGFGHAAGPAAYRLPPPTRRLAQIHPGFAPHPSDFAERRDLPPAMESHEPFQGHPGEMMQPHAMNGSGHPEFATAPGYHPPPAPPGYGQHPGSFGQGDLHPSSMDHTTPQFAHPENAPFHPQPEQHHSIPGHAPGENFHPGDEAFHPPAYHPPAQQFHPQHVEQPRPMQHAHPEQHHEQGHPDHEKKPG